MISRRALIAGLLAQARRSPLVDTHVHLFDPVRFPYHKDAPYRPPAQRLDEYAGFVKAARIDHAVIVHPEPYQDDHRYLEYCFQHEPSPGFFKGTCLFDPLAPDTLSRMEALVAKHAGRIVTLRIHEMGEPGGAPATGGAIKNRDLHSPAMKNVWRKARELKIAIQMHMLPYYAPQVADLAHEFEDVNVIIDHLGRPAQGTPAQYEGVLNLARFPRVAIKYSGATRELAPTVRRVFDAFGPARMIWGGLGMNLPDFKRQRALFKEIFAFARAEDRAAIAGRNALRLFGW